MEKDEIKTVKIDYKMDLFGEHNILNFIGRSVLLERHGHPDQTYIAQILPLQPSSCKKVLYLNFFNQLLFDVIPLNSYLLF